MALHHKPDICCWVWASGQKIGSVDSLFIKRKLVGILWEIKPSAREPGAEFLSFIIFIIIICHPKIIAVLGIFQN